MINFSGKLTVDSSLYKKLRYTSPREVIDTIQPFVESENFIIADNVFIKAAHYGKGDSVIIKYGEDIESEVASSKGKVEPVDVLLEILRIACAKKHIRIRTARGKDVIEAIKNYYTS